MACRASSSFDECLPGRRTAVLAQSLYALDDAVDVFLRGCDSPLGLLLEGIDDVDRFCELDRVDGAVPTGKRVRMKLRLSREEAFPRLDRDIRPFFGRQKRFAEARLRAKMGTSA